MSFLRFFSLEDAMAAARVQHDPWLGDGDPFWWGGKTLDQAVDDILAGRGLEEAGEITPYLRTFDTYAREDTPQPAYDIAGFYPDVPAFLAGRPDNMRHLEPVPSRLTPITAVEQFSPRAVVLMVSVPVDVDPFFIARRAAIIAAYATRLSESHPVELWIASAARLESRAQSDKERDAGWAVRMDPSQVGQVVALCDTAGARMVGINLMSLAVAATLPKDRAYIIECDGYSMHRSPHNYADAVCRAFRFSAGSLVITGAFDTVDPEEIIQSASVYEGSGFDAAIDAPRAAPQTFAQEAPQS